jgi:hypothetical protein
MRELQDEGIAWLVKSIGNLIVALVKKHASLAQAAGNYIVGKIS